MRSTKVIECVVVVLGASALAIAGTRLLRASSNGPSGDVQSGSAPEIAEPAPDAMADLGFVGVVIPSDAVDVAARVDGRVEEVMVRLGDTVKPNQVLARIDDRALRDGRAMAHAALQGVRADEAKAEFELAEASERKARWDETAASSDMVVSTEELNKVAYAEKYATQRLKVARAMSLERGAALAEFDRKLADTWVRAQFSGRVAARYVDPGATVAVGMPIARIVSADALWIRFAVPQDRRGTVELGMAIEARGDNLGSSLRGVVEKIAPEIDAAAQMVFVEARISAPRGVDAGTLAGSVVHVTLVATKSAATRSP